MEKLPSFIEARRRNWRLLGEELADAGDHFILPEPTPNSEPSWFGFLLTVREDAGFTREDIVNHLESRGIQTRMLFAGNLIKHPCFDEMRKTHTGYRVVGDLVTTDRIMRDTFWVGVYPGMSDEMVKFIRDQIKGYFGTLSDRAKQKLVSASPEQLARWADCVLNAESLRGILSE